jgi:hypothetical protein
MTIVEEADNLLSRMTAVEKAQLLQRVVREMGGAFAGIESRPEVCGGEACIVRTRIPVWVLEQSCRLGMSEGGAPGQRLGVYSCPRSGNRFSDS